MTHKTLTERMDALTGYDEDAIEEWFDRSIYDAWGDLLTATATGRIDPRSNAFVLRALLFVEKTSADGLPSKLAHEMVQKMSLGDVSDELGYKGGPLADGNDEDDEQPSADVDPSETPEGKGGPDGE
jgi:hypothetical protein